MRSDGASLVRGSALSIPLADETVDLIVTSPPYWDLRAYTDDGEVYDGQIGSEPTPQEYLEHLWQVTAECQRVLKPSGSMFWNVGDKYASTGGHTAVGGSSQRQGRSNLGELTRGTEKAPSGFRPKSLMGLPWRYALGCIDGLAGDPLILRAELLWEKANGLPESVTDRVRRNHEQWFHFTKEGTYFSGVDEIREPYAEGAWDKGPRSSYPAGSVSNYYPDGHHEDKSDAGLPLNPLGKLPGSVWKIPTESLVVPSHLGLTDEHYAAFPQEWPRRIILGWSPSAVCALCGEGRRPISSKEAGGRSRSDAGDGGRGDRGLPGYGNVDRSEWAENVATTIVGYVCACTPRTSHRGKRGDWKAGRVEEPEKRSDDWHAPGASVPRRQNMGESYDLPMWEYQLDEWTPAATRQAVVLDPFAGTGTTVMVARALGRYGVGMDLSFGYLRLASWRVWQSGHAAKTLARTNAERQGSMF